MIINKCFLQLVLSLSIGTFLASQVRAEGDPEYGEYLSSECVTCHRANAVGDKIPSLNGMDEEGFTQMMTLYRNKQLENQTMQTVAGRLSDEDIAALAAYYSALPDPE